MKVLMLALALLLPFGALAVARNEKSGVSLNEETSASLASFIAQRVLKDEREAASERPDGTRMLFHSPLVKSRIAHASGRSLEEDENDAEDMECDAAFMACLDQNKCVDCFLELQSKEIDWASVTQDTQCVDVLSYLYGGSHCLSQRGDAAAEKRFCSAFHSCVTIEPSSSSSSSGNGDSNGQDDNPDNKKKKIDCDSLTECVWDGIHPQFLGDGICHDGLSGCYNHKICGYDGGDCCSDTCVSQGKYVECGSDGFACRDPASAECDFKRNKECPKKKETDDEKRNKPDRKVECEEDETVYRLIMYDSFGDGWDETKIKVQEAGGGKFIYEGGLDAGAQGTAYVCLKRNVGTCYHVEVTGGVWGNEVSWEIRPASEGAPALAGGGALATCEFGVAGAHDQCIAGPEKHICDPNKPNIAPNNDPSYKEFKDMYQCINDKCPIQVGACQKDPTCEQCFVEQTPQFCFGIESFNAVVDCTMCQCTPNKGSEFCKQKASPGLPPGLPIYDDDAFMDEDDEFDTPCTPDETIKGGAAVLEFGKCTDFDEVAMMVSDFDQNNFGDLDTFESCAHAYRGRPDHGGHTALSCMQILVNAMNAQPSESSTAPTEAIAALAKLLYNDAENFCECAQKGSRDAPLCPSFFNFKTLLFESVDACVSLDEIDCDAWAEFSTPCSRNLANKFSTIDFSKQEQCQFVHDGCGGAGPFPAFRRIDCQNQIPDDAWSFYGDYGKNCLKDAPTPPAPTPPAPTPYVPTPPGPTPPAPTPYAPTPTPPTPYTPSDSSPSSDKKPYVPPEDRGKGYTPSSSSSSSTSSDKKSSHWFRNLFIVCLFGGVGYYIYKRRSEGFTFIRLPRRRYGGDGEMYSGLAMDSSTSFEPPSLPPTPASMGGDPQYI